MTNEEMEFVCVGHFRGAVLPSIRTFAELPSFLNANRHLLIGRRVLMYCTGGIRCETASAYVSGVTKSVAQLHGGIHRFLERYPNGAAQFVGKNLVFDRRRAIGAVDTPVVGRCIGCEKAWDCYARQCRCVKCRALVLVCSDRCHFDFINEHVKGMCALCRTRGGAVRRRAVKRRRPRREKLAPGGCGCDDG